MIIKKIIIFLILIVLPSTSIAAGIVLRSEKSVLSTDDSFTVDVFFDTSDKVINAVESKIIFPAEYLDYIEAKDGNSVINFWIEKPHVTNQGTVSFSGITANGFTGQNKLLFSLVFRTKKIGQNSISTSETLALLNDGVGTKLDIEVKPLNFTISNELPATPEKLTEDKDNPEEFFPQIGNDNSIYNGKYFLVFETQDKGTGIDHYEVKEGFFGEYTKETSPYLIKNQELTKKIYVKAIDKNGNERVVSLNAQKPIKWYQDYIILSIIGVLLILLFSQKIWRKFIR